MPIVKTPAALCPPSIKNADLAIIAKAKRILTLNWILIVLFVVVFLTCCWFIGKNSVEIYTVYHDWKANVRATRQERSKGFFNDLTDPMYDDEVYPNTNRETISELRSENQLIKNKIREVKKEYSEYNRALFKSGKIADVMDEKILSGKHDDYARKALKKQ
jgi:hypothetical protein